MTVRTLSAAEVPTARGSPPCSRSSTASSSARTRPLRLALACLLARGHLLIEDIPGVGKSTLAQALAATLGLQYARVQFTSDLLPADVLGVSIFDAQAQAFRFHPGPVFNSVVLADEINRAPPKTQSALLEAMEERQVSHGRHDAHAAGSVLRHRDAEPGRADRRLSAARVAARPLPDGHRARLSGRRRPSATSWPAATGAAQIATLPALADPPTLLEWQREAADVHVAPALLDYVQALLAATRGNTGGEADAGARRGLSPRAGLLLLAAARAWALLCGRPMALPEDVQAVFPSVAGHRLAGGARAGALQAQALLRDGGAAVDRRGSGRAAAPRRRRCARPGPATPVPARAGGRPAGRPAPSSNLHPAHARGLGVHRDAALMLLTSLNYALSLGFAVTFLLGGPGRGRAAAHVPQSGGHRAPPARRPARRSPAVRCRSRSRSPAARLPRARRSPRRRRGRRSHRRRRARRRRCR